MFSSPNFVFKTQAAAEAFVASLGEPDPGEAYVIETNGVTFIVAHFADGERLGAI